MPREQWTLALVSGQHYFHLKGVVEQLVAAMNSDAQLQVGALRHPLFDTHKSCELQIDGRRLGFLGEVTPGGLRQFGLRTPASCAELNLETLADIANLIPQHRPQSPYPSIARDLNLIVEEQVRWADLVATVRQAGGDVLEDVTYQETYRDPQKDGVGRKRLLLSISLRSGERTLTSEEADRIRDRIVSACSEHHAAQLLA